MKTNSQMAQMLKLADKDFKAAIKPMFNVSQQVTSKPPPPLPKKNEDFGFLAQSKFPYPCFFPTWFLQNIKEQPGPQRQSKRSLEATHMPSNWETGLPGFLSLTDPSPAELSLP